MAARKGNNYWEFRQKHGRNFKYTPEDLWSEAEKYFEWISKRVWNKKEAIKSGELAGQTMDVPTQTPMSIQSFCLFADIDENTFGRYEKEEGYEAFWEITTCIKGIIESNQFEGATVGIYNPNIIARKLGLSENSKVDHTTKGDKIKQSSVDLSVLDNETLEKLLDATRDNKE